MAANQLRRLLRIATDSKIGCYYCSVKKSIPMRKTELSHSSWKRSGGIDGSGLTHIQYAHRKRPTLLHVTCPSCGDRATATKTSEDEFTSGLSGDLSGTWHLDDWNISCPSCGWRATGRPYDDLPPLFYSEDGLLAWNREHLDFLERHLNQEDTDGDRYSILAAYIRGEWLRKRDQSLRTIRRLKSKTESGRSGD